MKIKAFYDNLPIPRLIKVFLLRALLLFVGWQLVYHFVFMPFYFPDMMLTNITAYCTAKVLSLFYQNVSVIYLVNRVMKGSQVLVGGNRILRILDSCNALDIFVLYISFLFCFPGDWKRRAKFILLGVPYIFVLNIIRCALIAWLNMAHRGLVEITHHYIFTAAMYILVFYIWVLYTKKVLPDAA